MSSYCREDKTLLKSKCSSPGCVKPVDDDHRYFDFHSIACAVCESWKHWSCHGLSKTDYLLIREMSDYPFICISCRKRCDKNYNVRRILQELINENVGISLGQKGSELMIKDVKVKIELSLHLDPTNDSAENVRRSPYDPVPSPVAVERKDVEPVYEIPKFLETQALNRDEEDESNKMCYYV